MPTSLSSKESERVSWESEWSRRIAEIVVRDERAVIPIGAFNPQFGVTLSMPGILGRTGVSRILEPAMTQEAIQGLQ